MILFFYETDFHLDEENTWRKWIESAAEKEGFSMGDLNYIFMDDDDLLDMNLRYLNHDYYTDVIGFQSSEGKRLSGDIFISVDRVQENAVQQETEFWRELARVMIHGLLHFMGYLDDNTANADSMRDAEDRHLAYFVEPK